MGGESGNLEKKNTPSDPKKMLDCLFCTKALLFYLNSTRIRASSLMHVSGKSLTAHVLCVCASSRMHVLLLRIYKVLVVKHIYTRLPPDFSDQREYVFINQFHYELIIDINKCVICNIININYDTNIMSTHYSNFLMI
jgi:hypothetical protein